VVKGYLGLVLGDEQRCHFWKEESDLDILKDRMLFKLNTNAIGAFVLSIYTCCS